MAADFPLSLAQTPFLILLTLHPNIHLQHSSPVQLYAAMEIKEDCQMWMSNGSSFRTYCHEGVGQYLLCLAETQSKQEWEGFRMEKRKARMCPA